MNKPSPRQRPIPVTSQERETINLYKSRYEQATGTPGDWGDFLDTVVKLGLAALGIYALSKAMSGPGRSVTVKCLKCASNFLLAVPAGTPRAVHTGCPHCSTEMIVDLGVLYDKPTGY